MDKKQIVQGGLRLQGIRKSSSSNRPLISIITVVYNGEKYIEDTILSVIEQTYTNIEYIIIDGSSTDTTLNIIKKYDNKIDYWISESDQGIYDAMNKGINESSDGYLWFINAGDLIYSPTTIEEIFQSGIYSIYYGKTALINNQNNILNILSSPKNLSWKDLYKGMLVSHQSIIIEKKIANLYNLSYKYVSDHDWIINAFKKTNSISYIDIIFSKYLLEGFSQQNFSGCWQDRFEIIKSHYPRQYLYLNYYLYFKQRFKNMIKKVLGRS